MSKYTANDPEDASDLYGRSKLLGEVTAPHAVTLRTVLAAAALGVTMRLLWWSQLVAAISFGVVFDVIAQTGNRNLSFGVSRVLFRDCRQRFSRSKFDKNSRRVFFPHS